MPDTIEALIRRCHTKLLRFLSGRLRSEQDASDLAQEAYIRLLRYNGDRSGEDLRRTLFRIAHNLLTDHWRRRKFRGPGTEVPIDELDIESHQAELERQVAGEQLLARLETVILSMPEKRRTVFLMSRIEGLNNPEIARRCGISVKTVEKHIAIAIDECRREVDDGS